MFHYTGAPMRTAISVCILFCAAAAAGVLSSPPAPTARDLKLSPVDRLYYSAQFELLRTRDPRTGAIPAGIRSREFSFAAALPVADRDAAALRRLGRGAYVPGWKQRGPTTQAGRMLDLVFDVDDDRILFAGSASGGFWKSGDRGETWRKTSSPDAQPNVGCIVQDPRAGMHDVMYYGTGELLSTTDRSIRTTARTVGYGNGIYRSTDRGETWTALPSTVTTAQGSLTSPFHGVWDLAIAGDGWDAGAVYAACYGEILRSVDNGAHWEHVLGDPSAPSFSTDIVITPVLTYAAIGGYTVVAGTPEERGIFISTDRQDWIDITPDGFPGNARVVELAAAPSDPYTLYVLTERPEPYAIPQLAFTSSRHTLWKYVHNPATGTGVWQQRTSGLPNGGIGNAGNNGYSSLGGYCIAMAVHPENPDLLYLGGTNLYKSTNAFATAAQTVIIGGYPYGWSDTDLHPDQHAFAFLPSDPEQLFVANDGGIQFTPFDRQSQPPWTTRNSGLITSQFYRVAQDPATAADAFCIGGLQDNATYYNLDDTDPAAWTGIIGGDGMGVAVGPGRDFAIASVYTGRIYGVTFLPSGAPDEISIQRPDNLDDLDFSFFTVFALDPYDGSTFYLGGLPMLWRKDDIGASIQNPNLVDLNWHPISAAAFPDPDYVSAIGCASDASGRLYVGSSGGGILRVDDVRGDTPAATPIDVPGVPAGSYVSCLAVDPRDHDRVFAVFSNYAVQSVFLSTDAGSSWSPVSGNLEQKPDGSGDGPSVRWLAILPVKDGEIFFAATSAGLFSTTRLEGMSTVWSRESPDGIGVVCVDHVDARRVDGSVLAATQGSGVWATRVTGLDGIDGGPAAEGFRIAQLWPRPLRDRLQVEVVHERQASLRFDVHDVQGRLRLTERHDCAAGRSTHSMDVRTLPAGIFFLRIDDGRQQRTVKLLKMAP